MTAIHPVSEVRNKEGVLTHKMCCVCFTMTPVEHLWRDERGQAWDLCSQACAEQTYPVTEETA